MRSKYYIEARTAYRCKDAKEYAELAAEFIECVEAVFKSAEALAAVTRSKDAPLVALESQVTHVETLVLQCMVTLTAERPPPLLKGKLSDALKRGARSRGRFHISSVLVTEQPLDEES